jgi:chromosomal replication initiation ATPase DnaA
MTQLTFDLPHRATLSRADFFVSDGNATAVGWVDRWPDWPTGVLMLHGPSGSGKTHLAHLWCERAAADVVVGKALDEKMVERLVIERRYRVAIDDADGAPELALLHLHNFCLECRGNVLITARRSPESWRVGLDDLGSRLRAALAVAIGPPDDALLGAVLVKHFADRQLYVAPEVITYLIRRMERSFSAAADITARLDAAALRDKGAVTISLARNILAQAGYPSASDFGVT